MIDWILLKYYQDLQLPKETKAELLFDEMRKRIMASVTVKTQEKFEPTTILSLTSELIKAATKTENDASSAISKYSGFPGNWTENLRNQRNQVSKWKSYIVTAQSLATAAKNGKAPTVTIPNNGFYSYFGDWISGLLINMKAVYVNIATIEANTPLVPDILLNALGSIERFVVAVWNAAKTLAGPLGDWWRLLPYLAVGFVGISLLD